MGGVLPNWHEAQKAGLALRCAPQFDALLLYELLNILVYSFSVFNRCSIRG